MKALLKKHFKTYKLNFITTLLALTACQGSGQAAKGRSPFWGTPELSDFGSKNYLINGIEEKESIENPAEVSRLSESITDPTLCSYTLSEEQLYNPYKNLGLRATSWTLEKNIEEVGYLFKPTRFSHIKVDYWKKEATGNFDLSGRPTYLIQRQTTDCYNPSGWRSRSPRLELGVHPFAKSYTDCLATGIPDIHGNPTCINGMEVIGGLTHRISGHINPHRFRVSWWLKKPKNNEEEEVQKIRDALKIPFRIPLTLDSIYSEVTETDHYRVRALAFAEEEATELPRYWLISDEQGTARSFLPLNGVEISNDNLSAREKLKELHRPAEVANFAGHFAWDRVERRQKKSNQIPFGRFMDDQLLPLWKKLKSGSNLKVFLIFRAQDSDDVFLEEFILKTSGELSLKKITQLNAYGTTTLGLPTSSQGLDASGLEIYND